MKSKVAYLVEPRHFEIREEDVICGNNEVLIKLSVCALCNYELNHWMGKLGTYPQRIGHEAAGTIVEIGKNITKFKVGDKVTGAIWSAFTQYAVADENSLFLLDYEIDPMYGFIEPLKCVTTVVRVANPQAGDYGIVVGCGPMGLWCVQALSRSFLGGLICVDMKDENLALAKQFGAKYVINPKKENVCNKIREYTNGHMADFLIEGTGASSVVNSCMLYLKKHGKLILMSSYENASLNFDLTAATRNGLTIIAAHGSVDANDDWRRASLLLNNQLYESKSIVTYRYRLEDINKAFSDLENKPYDYIKGAIVF